MFINSKGIQVRRTTIACITTHHTHHTPHTSITITHYVVLARELAVDGDDNGEKKRLVTLLKGHVVRILKSRLSAKCVSYESEGTKIVSTFPEHPNVLREHVLKTGMSISRMYDESLRKYLAQALSLCRDGLETVLTSLAQGVLHLHKHGVGHFDIKPSNVLIKWSHTRGVFDGTSVVICDFGLVHELIDGMYDDRYSTHTYISVTSITSIHPSTTSHTHHRQSIQWDVERHQTICIP